MAKQESMLKFKGAIEDLAFFKSRDGYQVRRKSGVSAERVLTDPLFQRTRENGAEFGRGGRAAKYLRTALRSMLLNVSDPRMRNRLTQAMIRVIKSDTTSVRGERNVLSGDLTLLAGFEFNEEALLARTLFSSFTKTIDRASGSAVITLPAMSPTESLRPPAGATHVRLVSGLAAVDFVTGESQIVKVTSAELLLSAESFDALTLNLSLPSAGTLPLFLLFGTEFYQEVNGRFYGLRNGAYNALSLLDVNVEG